MTETIRTDRKELTSGEIVRELDRGNRVLIEVTVLGRSMTMALRRRDRTYYCDTPMKLLTYDSEAAMRACLERYRLAKPGGSDESEDETAAATSTSTSRCRFPRRRRRCTRRSTSGPKRSTSASTSSVPDREPSATANVTSADQSPTTVVELDITAPRS